MKDSILIKHSVSSFIFITYNQDFGSIAKATTNTLSKMLLDPQYVFKVVESSCLVVLLMLAIRCSTSMNSISYNFISLISKMQVN